MVVVDVGDVGDVDVFAGGTQFPKGGCDVGDVRLSYASVDEHSVSAVVRFEEQTIAFAGLEHLELHGVVLTRRFGRSVGWRVEPARGTGLG